MKILFVNSFVSYYKDMFPLGLVSLCTILKENSIECAIIDYSQLYREGLISEEEYKHKNLKQFLKYIFDQNPDIVSLYTMSNSFEFSIAVAQRIKMVKPEITIIFAGPQASAFPEEVIDTLPFVDLVAIGEGEATIIDVIHAIESKKYETAPNICYRYNGETKINRNCDLVADLDDLPFLNFDLIKNINEFETFPLEAGRGCPFSCSFCSTKSFWKQKYRLKSVPRVISEMKYVIDNYGIRDFHIEHDSLTANRKQIFDFCKKLEDEKLDVIWGCSSRVDVLDLELIKILREAGCRRIFLGLESGSERIQRDIKKNLKISKIKEMVPLLISNGFKLRCSFMYGFPTETVEDIAETLSLIGFLVSCGVNDIQLHRLSVLPGTEIYRDYKERLLPLPLNCLPNFSSGADATAFEKVISDYPNLFPQYCEISGLVPNTKYVESFVNYFLKMLFRRFRNTYRYLKVKYSNFFELYLDMIECCAKIEPLATDLMATRITAEQFEKKLIESFDDYIQICYNKSDKEFLSAIFQFDKDYLNWYFSKEESETKRYSYNVLEFIKNGKANIKEESCIRFYKSGGKVYASEYRNGD